MTDGQRQQKPPVTFHYTGCFMGILKRPIIIPIKLGSIISYIQQITRSFLLLTCRHHIRIHHPRHHILPFHKAEQKNTGFTVDGRNPAPVDMVNIPLFTTGFIHPRWLAGFLNHQQFF